MCILRANRALLYYKICRSRLQKRNRSRKICIYTGLFHITFTLHASGIQILTYYWGLNASFLNQNEDELDPSLLIRDCSFCENMLLSLSQSLVTFSTLMGGTPGLFWQNVQLFFLLTL